MRARESDQFVVPWDDGTKVCGEVNLIAKRRRLINNDPLIEFTDLSARYYALTMPQRYRSEYF